MGLLTDSGNEIFFVSVTACIDNLEKEGYCSSLMMKFYQLLDKAAQRFQKIYELLGNVSA